MKIALTLTLSHRNGRGDWFLFSYPRPLAGRVRVPCRATTIFSKERAKDTKNGEPDYKNDRILTCVFSAFVLFVFFVVVYSG
jgi:hypothetical protein